MRRGQHETAVALEEQRKSDSTNKCSSTSLFLTMLVVAVSTQQVGSGSRWRRHRMPVRERLLAEGHHIFLLG